MPHVAATPDTLQLCQSTVWLYASSTVAKVGRPDEAEATGEGEVDGTDGGATEGDVDADGDADADAEGDAVAESVGGTGLAALVRGGASVAIDGAVLIGGAVGVSMVVHPGSIKAQQIARNVPSRIERSYVAKVSTTADK